MLTAVFSEVMQVNASAFEVCARLAAERPRLAKEAILPATGACFDAILEKALGGNVRA